MDPLEQLGRRWGLTQVVRTRELGQIAYFDDFSRVFWIGLEHLSAN